MTEEATPHFTDVRLTQEAGGEKRVPSCPISKDHEEKPANHDLLPALLPPPKDLLYGRQVEESKLIQAYNRCVSLSVDGDDNKAELVLITGPSGTGKSRLAESLRAHVTANGGFFISGKFDSLERPETSYPLIRAFTDLVHQLTALDDQQPEQQHNKYKTIYDALQKIMNTDYLLCDMVPALKRFQTNQSTPAVNVNGVEAAARVELAFCRLVKAIASPSMPLVLFLDDLQWAKPAPLGIMAALLKNSDIKGFMLLGACRGNEVPLTHHLAVKLRDLEDSAATVITDIQLTALDRDTVGQMVADNLGKHRKELTDLVWEKSGGNIFFAVQMIRRIREADAKKVTTVQPSDFEFESAGDLLTEVIRGLPKDAQDILRIASCFGAEFDTCLLEELVVCDVEVALAFCQEKDLVCQGQAGKMRFVHDQIQQSAYSLIPDGQRESTHLDIARRLWNSLSEQELKMYGFAVVRQLRLGCSLITDQDERYRVADLLCQAGEYAQKTASFDEAASHFELGISLLGDRHWKDEYFLTLALYEGAANVAFCIGNYDRAKKLSNSVIHNALQKEHKIKSYTTIMESFGGASDGAAAVGVGLKALSDMGYAFPKKPGLLQILGEIYKTKRMAKRHTNEDIKQLPRLANESEEAGIINLLMRLHPYLITSSPHPGLIPLVPLRAVRLVLSHGLCPAAPIAFAALALISANHLGEIELGWRLAELSMDLMHQIGAYEWETRVVVCSHSYVYAIRKPLKELLAPMQDAHLAGLTSGDSAMSMVVASNRVGIAITASVPLRPLVDEMRTTLNFMIQHQGNGSMGVAYLLPCFQFVLNLVYRKENPVSLTGEVMNEDEFQKIQVTNPLSLAILRFYKLMLACYFHEFKYAEYLVAPGDEGMEGFPPHMRIAMLLYSGVAYSALSMNRTRQRLKFVQKTLRSMKGFTRFSGDRYNAQVYILEGEIAAIRGRTESAASCFNMAIQRAEKEGFLNLVGLASERLSRLFYDTGRTEEADDNMVQAVEAYRQWGADAKVSQLISQLSEGSRKRLGQSPEAALSKSSSSHSSGN